MVTCLIIDKIDNKEKLDFSSNEIVKIDLDTQKITEIAKQNKKRIFK